MAVIYLDIESFLLQGKVLTKGSESYLYDGEFLNRKTIIKERKQKAYRLKEIDDELRLFRMRLEARIIKTLLRMGESVPALYGIDLYKRQLILEHVEGKPFSHFINEERLFFLLGKYIARLHTLHIIHSDLSPLNVIISKDNTLYLIDFGLAYFSEELKDKIMDLYIFQGSLKLYNASNKFTFFKQGYQDIVGDSQFKVITHQLESLNKKGRYQK